MAVKNQICLGAMTFQRIAEHSGAFSGTDLPLRNFPVRVPALYYLHC